MGYRYSMVAIYNEINAGYPMPGATVMGDADNSKTLQSGL